MCEFAHVVIMTDSKEALLSDEELRPFFSDSFIHLM